MAVLKKAVPRRVPIRRGTARAYGLYRAAGALRLGRRISSRQLAERRGARVRPARHSGHAFQALVAVVGENPTMNDTPPAPLEWHPAYREKPWLLDWLEGRGTYRADRIYLPILQPVRFMLLDPEAPLVPEPLRAQVLTKHRAVGLAPYVGRPFRYEWFFAVDELGRAIAGDARIRHANPDFLFCYGPFEYTHEARNYHDPDTPVWP